MTDFDPNRHIDTLAPLLGLDIRPEWRVEVAQFLTIAHGMAKTVAAAPLPADAHEGAATFRPGTPE